MIHDDASISFRRHAVTSASAESAVEEANEALAICGLCVRARNHTIRDANASATGSPLASIDFERLLDAP